MRLVHPAASCLALLACPVITAGSAFGVGGSYVEDFATTQYRDRVNTTASWDTVAGGQRRLCLCC